MERHRCKLCSRSFANGRALGGHMKAHLATLPLPPKPQQQLADRAESASSSSSSSGEEQEDGEAEEKALVYGLRENPKKSFRLADPEFSFAVDAGSVVQDRESETESKNPTRRRSKRNRKPGVVGESQSTTPDLELVKKAKLRKPSLSESPEAMSSVSDTSPEEDVAMCLMMLSRDIRMRRNNGEQDQEHGKKQVERSIKIKEQEEPEEIKIRRVRGKHRCEKCRKTFRSYQALGSHKTICYRDEAGHGGNERIFECPFCDKVFGSGQALGGHKRSHLLASSATAAANAAASASASAAASSSKFEISVIDLNLLPPAEEDDFSVVSDA
ncbi:zinc finger protein ZAT4 [Corylus avellana]|uniref:zinc finger protein ZAT4 n=1 Tax=Corylus avellana TaxID=13451 RepID=UPI001E21399C|nr:zinc finger protein ZAT4 [Corylus avellana]